MPELLPLVLLAGVPGSGKTTVAANLKGSAVISMDDFYLAESHPLMPHRHGSPDWEAPTALDMKSLETAVLGLLKRETIRVPCYDMKHSQPAGNKELDPGSACAVVVEGVHAFELQFASGVSVSRVLLVSPTLIVTLRRLIRDVKEERFPLYKALLQAVPMLIRYRKYNYRCRQQADCTLRSRGDPVVIAAEIKDRTQFWQNCK